MTFNKETIDLIVYCLTGLVTLIGAVSSLILGIIAKNKTKEANIISNLYKLLSEVIPLYMEQAEMTGSKGEAKKSFVIDKLTKYCEAHKIEATEEQLSQLIEELMSFSIKVNNKFKLGLNK